MKKSLLFLLSFISLYGFGQKPSITAKKLTCEQILLAGDMEHALNVGVVKKVALMCSPKGSGSLQEVSSRRNKNKYYFEKEHNVVWIKFKILVTGNLIFRIIPSSDKDDYDFLLFKDEGNSTNQKIRSKTLKPIRSNLARNKKENGGITGLNTSAIETHAVSGPRNQFSKHLSVKKGDYYYLAIDNVYDQGRGAMIHFNYFTTKKIIGFISNKTSFLGAEVNWNDAKTGETLEKTYSDSLTGYYEMEVPLDIVNPSKKYVLSAYTEKHFFMEKNFTAEEIKSHQSETLNLVLPKLKKGIRNSLNNINFKGGSPELLEGAYSSLKRLKRLMKKNKSLRILIEGHTNGCDGGVKTTQLLSENRAFSVKKYLKTNGINEGRIETIGWNCKHMLFPNAIRSKNLKQQSLNRRVEILVLDY